MDNRVPAGIVLVVLVVLLRHFAARRVRARQGQFVWLMFVPTLFGSVVILWVSIQVFASAPLLGALMAIGGGIYLFVLIRFLTRLSRSVTAATPEDDIGAVILEPVADYMTAWSAMMLIGGLVAVVGLIVWGVTQTAR